nr:MAG TPA: hypothetical protein [Caudoviricetes sp.]
MFDKPLLSIKDYKICNKLKKHAFSRNFPITL